jgi:LuxR family maltose regulon positive regulatory protein
LTRLIEASAARAVLLCAPAGYGKTTVAREWVADRPHAWYRPSPASADVAAFAAELAEAVAPLAPQAGDRLRVRLRDGELEPSAAASLLAGGLARWPADAWLVVDDYHLAATDEVAELVDRLLELTPLRLLVTARTRPRWATPRRAVHGELVELTAGQLAMTAAEAAAVHGRRRAAGFEALVERAEGWPALIGLAAVAGATELPSGQVTQALYRYLAAEVLAQRSPSEQRFMLLAAVPDELDPDTLVRLEQPDSERCAAALLAAGLLHETEKGGMRFHPLLRELLRETLRTRDAALFTALAARLARAAADDGRWEEAFERTLDAGDVEAAARIVGAAYLGLAAEGRFATVERWLDRCSSARGDSAFKYARAEIDVRRARPHEAVRGLTALIGELPDSDPLAPRAWSWLADAYERLGRRDASVDAAVHAAEIACDPGERASALFCAVRMASEERPELLPGLVATLAAEPPSLDQRVLLAMSRLFATNGTHDLSGLAEEFADLLSRTASGVPRLHRVALSGAGYVALYAGDYREARKHMRSGFELARTLCFDRGVIAGRLVDLANASIGLRELRVAERELEQSSREVPPLAWLRCEQSNARAKLRIAQGDLEAAVWADVVTEGPRYRVAERKALSALAAAALGLEDVARRSLEESRPGKHVHVDTWIHGRFTEAVLGDRPAADTVVDALRRGLQGAFTVAYRAYPPLLAEAAQEASLRPELVRLTLAANDRQLARAAGLLPQADAGPPRECALTPREREVLDLVAQGLSDRDVAARLFISQSTAKRHVHNILEKLGVSSRTQAINAGRSLVAG